MGTLSENILNKKAHIFLESPNIDRYATAMWPLGVSRVTVRALKKLGFYDCPSRLLPPQSEPNLSMLGLSLLDRGEDHYYTIRDRFNENGSPFDFLFLSRACFNGMMRFNRKGGFNVPFCRKPERFRPALITKIANQVNWAMQAMKGKDWNFIVQDWRATLAVAKTGDMVYCDPPYVGRHTDYYNGFTDEEADDLARTLIISPAGFAMSMWLENKYRRNDYVDRWFNDYPQRTMSHFYHVGPQESLRNEMTEVIILSKGNACHPADKPVSLLPLFEDAELVDV